ncbi:class I SAM-dependent methyltransferase [Sporosarcina limicola]|nr:class I SAM-dependent methyltransferase [Sporosarcina limicola]
MNEKDHDRLLRIKTAGAREWLNQSSHYNRYEATPYAALEELFQDYEVKKADVFVDFGCGKGRLSFYIHNRFHVSVTGIEMSGQLYQEALENQASYMQKAKRAGGSVRFECGLAEEYEVEPGDNRFYFFNPFSIQIFMKVIDTILLSVEMQKRSVDVILYYPTDDYSEFLETSTPFVRLKEVRILELYEQDDNERFLIYRL